MTTSLYKDDNDYYYVIHLTEDIHHFFLGFLDDMEAPVVAVAKLEKTLVRKIIYDANGGTFLEGNTLATERPTEEVDSTYTVRLPSGYKMSREGFDSKKVWCVNSNGTGISYINPQNLTSEELDTLFGEQETVVLYALWDNRTPEVMEGLSIYAAMKGNVKNGKERKGLEELMTFRTWKSIDKATTVTTTTTVTNEDGTVSTKTETTHLADNTVSFAANGTGNKRNAYNKDLNIYEEVVNIVPRSNNYDYTAFFDLSSDFTYYDYHTGTIKYPEDNYKDGHNRKNWGGLFKKTLYESDYRVDDEDFNLFRIIEAIANGYDPEDAEGCPRGYNGVGCLDGINAKGGNYEFKFFGEKGTAYFIKDTYDLTDGTDKTAESKVKQIRYRSHTSFNLTSGWAKRSGEKVAISPAYVQYVKGYLKKFLEELQAKKGSATTLADMHLTDEEIESIIKDKKIPPVYFSYIKAAIESNPNAKLTDIEIDSIVDNSSLAPLTSGEDPLYVRIESEELNEGTNDRYGTLVRQIWLNVDSKYVAEGNRPMVIFYEGPDRGLSEEYDKLELENGQSPDPSARYPFLTARNSQPVILNLNADFKGILFAPNSPVAIIGNGHKLEGFVIAEKFVKPITMPNDKYDREKIINGVKVYTNEWGDIGYEDLDFNSSIARRTKGSEIPYNMGKAESDYQSFDDYLNSDSYRDYAQELQESQFDTYKKNLKENEYVFYASTFNLNGNSHYDNFGIAELTREVYSSLNDNDSEDMFFTTKRSKWIT